MPDSVVAQAWQSSKCISFIFHHRSQAETSKVVNDTAENENEKENCSSQNKPTKRQKFKEDDDSYSEQDDENDSDFE